VREAALGLLVPHLLFVGWIEALMTASVVRALAREAAGGSPALALREPGSRAARVAWAALGVLVLATPVGALVEAPAFGEDPARVAQDAGGAVPAGIARLSGIWGGLLSDYEVPGVGKVPGTIIAAAVGVLAIALCTWILGRVFRERTTKPEGEPRASAP
jgi:hypothetical protein